MNTPKTALLVLWLTGAFLTLGFVTGPRRLVSAAAIRCARPAAVDPAVMSQIARAQAAAALAQSAGAATRLPPGF